MVDHQLAAAVEQIGQRLFAGRCIERVSLFDLHPGHFLPFGADLVAQLRFFLLGGEQRLAGFQPLFA
ncbi:hypothetical protein D3C87_2168170 [compost metagenome]